MSLASQILRLVKYPPERLVESRFVATIAGNAVVRHFEIPDVTPYLVWVKEIGMDRNASLQALLHGQAASRRYENPLPFGAAWAPLDDSIPVNSPFDYEVFFDFTNLTGVAVNNYRARVIYEVQKYRVADKIALGVSEAAMSSEELALADKYLIKEKVKTGELPMPYPPGSLQSRRIGQYSGTPAAASETTILDVTVPEGHKAVLRFVWCSPPAANLGDLQIRIYREKSLYLQIFPYMMPNWATATRHIPPLDLWIPALDQMRVTLFTTPGGHGAILAQAIVEIRKLTIFDKLAWNEKLTPEERDTVDRLSLRDKLDAGIYDLFTPVVGGTLGRSS